MEPIILEIPETIQLTEDQFFDLCLINSELVIERNHKNQFIIMTPAGSISSHRNLDLSTEINLWNRKYQLGIVFDSSGGFRLADKSVLAPDTSFVTKERWEKIPLAEQKKFAPICPDFIAELRSETDSLKRLKLKMECWIKNGCRLAWLLDPNNEKAYIYHPDGGIEIIKSYKGRKLSGENVLPEFELDLELFVDH
jgi:Uma2 family endonuclease